MRPLHRARGTPFLPCYNPRSAEGAEREVSRDRGQHRSRLQVGGLRRGERFDLHLALFRQEVVYDLPSDIPVHLLEKHRLTDIPRAIWRLRALLEKLRPDVVLTPHTGISLFAGEALRLSRNRPAWIARTYSAVSGTFLYRSPRTNPAAAGPIPA